MLNKKTSDTLTTRINAWELKYINKFGSKCIGNNTYKKMKQRFIKGQHIILLKNHRDTIRTATRGFYKRINEKYDCWTVKDTRSVRQIESNNIRDGQNFKFDIQFKAEFKVDCECMCTRGDKRTIHFNKFNVTVCVDRTQLLNNYRKTQKEIMDYIDNILGDRNERIL
jgi:hypothetical protein